MTRTVDERTPATGEREGSLVQAIQAPPAEMVTPGLANLAAAVAGTPAQAVAISAPQPPANEAQPSPPRPRESSELDWKAISAALADQLRSMQLEHARTRQKLMRVTACAAGLGIWAASVTILLWF